MERQRHKKKHREHVPTTLDCFASTLAEHERKIGRNSGGDRPLHSQPHILDALEPLYKIYQKTKDVGGTKYLGLRHTTTKISQEDYGSTLEKFFDDHDVPQAKEKFRQLIKEKLCDDTRSELTGSLQDPDLIQNVGRGTSRLSRSAAVLLCPFSDSLLKLEKEIISQKQLLDELLASSPDVIVLVSALRLCLTPSCSDSFYSSIWNFRNKIRQQQLCFPKNQGKCQPGNGAHLNENLQNAFFVGYDNEYRSFQNIFHATSILLYGSSRYAPLLKLGTICELAIDSISWKEKNQLYVKVFENILNDNEYPNPSVCSYIGKFLDRNIILHIGSCPPNNMSYIFGPRCRTNLRALNLCVYEWQCHPVFMDLVSLRLQWPFPLQDYKPKTSLTYQEHFPPQSVSCNPLFSFPEIDVFYSKCNFCVDYNLPRCLHIFSKHIQAKANLQKRLDSDVYGNLLEMPCVPPVDKQLMAKLPQSLKTFIPYECSADNSCQYNSASIALTGSENLAYALRRCVTTDFMQHEIFYTACFEEMKYSSSDIKILKQKISSVDGRISWGNNETFLLLSRIISRQIVVFTLSTNEIRAPRVYDMRNSTSGYHAPVFIIKRGNHFQPMLQTTPQKINFTPDSEFKLLVQLAREHFSSKQNVKETKTKDVSQRKISHQHSDDSRGEQTLVSIENPISKTTETLLQQTSAQLLQGKKIVVIPQALLERLTKNLQDNKQLQTKNLHVPLSNSETIPNKDVGTSVRTFPSGQTGLINTSQAVNSPEWEYEPVIDEPMPSDISEVSTKEEKTLDKQREDGTVKLQKIKLASDILQNSFANVSNVETKKDPNVGNILYIYSDNVSTTELLTKDHTLLNKLGFVGVVQHGDQDKYNWYFNIFKEDIKFLQCEHAMKFFVMNSGLPSYWKDKIKFFEKSRKPESLLKLSKKLVSLQELQITRELTVQFFQKIKMPEHLIAVYTAEATSLFSKRRTSRLGEVLKVGERAKKMEIKHLQNCCDCDKRWLNLNIPQEREVKTKTVLLNNEKSIPKVNTLADEGFGVETQDACERSKLNETIANTTDSPSPLQIDVPLQKDVCASQVFSLDECVVDDVVYNIDDYDDIESFPSSKTAGEDLKDLQNAEEASQRSNQVKTRDEIQSEDMQKLLKIARALNISDKVLSYVPPEKFTFEVPWQNLQDIYDFDSKKFRKGKWANTISDCMNEIQKVCSFNAERAPQYNDPDGPYMFCVLKGHCRCDMTFTINIHHEPVKGKSLVCQVQAEGAFQLLQTAPTGRRLEGEKREALAKTLLHEKAGGVYLRNKNKNTLLRFLHNNNIQMSIKVLQKLRHESKHSLAGSPDVFEDIILLCSESEQQERGEIVRGFIQEKCFRENEINVKMYTESSLKLLLNCHSETDLVMNFDATGSVVLDKLGKQMLYYLAYIRTNEGHTFPLASMISQSGKAVDIARLFHLVKRDIKKIKPSFNKPLVSVAVCDFSFATMTALCNGINTQTMKDYIRDSYSILLRTDVLEKDRSIIFVCNSHILKSYVRLLAKHVKPKKVKIPEGSIDIKQLAVHSFAKILSSRDLIGFARSCYAFCETFCSENLSDEKLAKNVSFFKRDNGMEERQEDLMDSRNQEFDFESIFPSTEHFELRERSRFYHLFKAIRQKVLECDVSSNVDSESETFHPVVVDLIEKYYIQYAPFFCSMMLYCTNRSGEERYSNSPVESQFNFVKNVFINHDRHSLNIFLRHIYDFHVGRTMEVLSTVACSKNKKSKRKCKHFNIPEEDRPEVWFRRKQAKRTLKYMNKKVRHTPGNLTTQCDDLSEESRNFVSSNFDELENCNGADKTMPRQTTKVIPLQDKITTLPFDMEAIYSDVIKNASTAKPVEPKTGPYVSSNDGELQRALMKHREQMKKRKELENNTKRSEMFHGSLFIMEKNKTNGVVDRIDEEMEKYLEVLVETDDMFKYCEKVLGPLSDEPVSRLTNNGQELTDKSPVQLNASNVPELSMPGHVKHIDQISPKTRGDGYSFVATKLAQCNGITLNSRQILNLASSNEWLETEVIDFYCHYLKNKTRLNNENITITPSMYVYLNNREENDWVHARQSEIPWDDTLVLFDIQNQEKHIHPLLADNHYVLLELDRQTLVCTVYDSFQTEREKSQPGILQHDRDLIRKHVLPDFFMNEAAASAWEIRFLEDMPQQRDHVSCGIYVMSAAKDIIAGKVSNIRTPKCMETERMEIVREILTTTEEGCNILDQAGDNDELLKHLVNIDAQKAVMAQRIFLEERERKKKEKEEKEKKEKRERDEREKKSTTN